jgi:hypothetical protein
MLLPRSPRDWRITDRQWRYIADPVNLPEKARRSVEFTIYMFRFFCLNEEARRQTPMKKRRAKLKRAAQAGRDFIAAVSSLGFSEKETLRVFLPVNEMQEEESAERELVAVRLDTACSQVQRLVDWFDPTTGKIGPDRTAGQITLDQSRGKTLLFDLVQHLDRILLEHTGRQIRRSNKPHQPIVQFVRAACKVFDPRVGNGSIDEAMKAVISARGENRSRARR